jgi:cytochrome c biogenesis factor
MMRSSIRPFAAIIGIARVLIVSTPFVRGLVLIFLALVLVVVVLVALARWIQRKRTSSVPWVVSLVVSAITTTPQFIFGHHRHLAARTSTGVLYWLVVAALLRLVIFLADYFRNRSDRLHASAG